MLVCIAHLDLGEFWKLVREAYNLASLLLQNGVLKVRPMVCANSQAIMERIVKLFIAQTVRAAVVIERPLHSKKLLVRSADSSAAPRVFLLTQRSTIKKVLKKALIAARRCRHCRGARKV